MFVPLPVWILTVGAVVFLPTATLTTEASEDSRPPSLPARAQADAMVSEARPTAERGGAQAVVDYFVQRAMNTILTDDVTMMAFRRERA